MALSKTLGNSLDIFPILGTDFLCFVSYSLLPISQASPLSVVSSNEVAGGPG